MTDQQTANDVAILEGFIKAARTYGDAWNVAQQAALRLQEAGCPEAGIVDGMMQSGYEGHDLADEIERRLPTIRAQAPA